jgi:N-acetylglucosamine kinase-like BadF-type ATPase
MAKHFFLGLDVGSSKTHALIADESGNCVGFGKSGGGNHQTVGYDGLEEVLKQSFEQACLLAKITPDMIFLATRQPTYKLFPTLV